ncbi:uncharacterized protein J3R85_013515 [Psidium guajava]|nr:uncharacterized protein J3R85_013515 [Psidium guajava]
MKKRKNLEVNKRYVAPANAIFLFQLEQRNAITNPTHSHNGHLAPIFQTPPHDPGVVAFSVQEARPESPETRLHEMVGPALRVPPRTEPRRRRRRRRHARDVRSGGPEGTAQIQVRAGMLHGGESEATPQEDQGGLELPRRDVPFGHCDPARFGLTGAGPTRG